MHAMFCWELFAVTSHTSFVSSVQQCVCVCRVRITVYCCSSCQALLSGEQAFLGKVFGVVHNNFEQGLGMGMRVWHMNHHTFYFVTLQRIISACGCVIHGARALRSYGARGRGRDDGKRWCVFSSFRAFRALHQPGTSSIVECWGFLDDRCAKTPSFRKMDLATRVRKDP